MPTSSEDSTKAGQLKSRAISLLSKYARIVSSAILHASSETNQEKRLQLLAMVEEAEKTIADMGIEKALARANPYQLKMVDAFLDPSSDTIAFVAANQCLGPDTILDTLDGPVRVQDAFDSQKPLRMLAWDGRDRVAVMTSPVFIKPPAECYRVFLSNGRWFDCSAEHRVLTMWGEYNEISSVLATENTWMVDPIGAGLHMCYGVRAIGRSRLGIQPIFDLEVPKYHNYITAGVVHHNSGKSFAAGRMCVATWLRDMARPSQIMWVISPTTEKSVSGPQKELWEALPRSMFGDQSYDGKNGYGGQRPTLLFPREDGVVTVRFKTAAQFDSDPRSFEQEAIDLIWIDESIEESMYEALLPRCVARGARILISAIPDLPWMFDRFENAPPGSKTVFIKCGIDANRSNLSPGAIDSMKSRMSEEEWQMRGLGNFRFLSGLVYQEFLKEYAPEGHLCKPFRIPAKWPKWRALDWGNAHPTVCLWAAVAPNETIFIYREYHGVMRPVKDHAAAIKAKSEGETYQGAVICDPAIFNRSQSNAASIADEFIRCGLPCIAGVRTNVVGEWALVQRVKNRLLGKTTTGPLLQVFDNCEHLIWEFRRWKYKLDKNHKPMGSDAFEDRNNDALDALKYLIAAGPCYTPLRTEIVSTLDD